MAFIISKSIKYQTKFFGSKDKTYYYIVEGYREGTKVKRKKLYSLGESKNLNEKLAVIDQRIEKIKEEIRECERVIDDAKQGKFKPLVNPLIQYRFLCNSLEEAKLKIPNAEREKDEIRRLMTKYPNCCKG